MLLFQIDERERIKSFLRIWDEIERYILPQNLHPGPHLFPFLTTWLEESGSLVNP